MKVIKNELNLIKEKFSVPRRTKIIDAVLNYDIEETIQKRICSDHYYSQRVYKTRSLKQY